MFDAEIAATLLNRYASSSPRHSVQRHLQLLKEGNLNFSRHICRCGVGTRLEAGEFEFESLVFEDGSCALRIHTQNGTSTWTNWVSFNPPTCMTPTGDLPFTEMMNNQQLH